jgi:hypothetical protein
MSICEYFRAAEGFGILATAGDDGRIDAAIYEMPQMVDEHTIAFIIADRLVHKNLQSNPHATYLFMEKGSTYTGMRLSLTKIKEETNTEKLPSPQRTGRPGSGNEKKCLVSFRIDQVLPPVGPE